VSDSVCTAGSGKGSVLATPRQLGDDSGTLTSLRTYLEFFKGAVAVGISGFVRFVGHNFGYLLQTGIQRNGAICENLRVRTSDGPR